MYTIPSGKGESGESPMVAMKREVGEETGAMVTSSELLRHETYMGFDMYLYKVRYTGTPYNREPAKHSKFSWMHKADILKLTGSKSHFLTMALQIT
jgi:8-oxo-dGTP pyrophosphatase MutT (NUDIX family)